MKSCSLASHVITSASHLEYASHASGLISCRIVDERMKMAKMTQQGLKITADMAVDDIDDAAAQTTNYINFE